MVYLRSGRTAESVIQQKYQNPQDVYRKTTREEFRKTHPNLESAMEAQRKGWKALSDKQKEKYVKLYDESVKEYEDQLILFYGGTKKDVAAAHEVNKIPPRPKHPLNAYFKYLEGHREDYMKKNGTNPKETTTALSQQYNNLTDKQKKPYELEARREAEEYEIEITKWEKLYGDKFKVGQKMLKDLNKYHSQGRKKKLDYQEILSAKQKRKLVPLGDEETRQVRGKSGGRQSSVPRQSSAPKEKSNDRKSNDRKSQPSRSPSQNPKVQQEQQKVKKQKKQ